MSDRWSDGIRAGSVDVSIPVLLRDVDDNLEVTGKVFGDVTASYWRQGGVRTAITPATLAAVNSAHSDGGFKEVDATNQAGLYRFDLPDAAVAVGADWVVITIVVTGCFVFHERFNLTSTPYLMGEIASAADAPADATIWQGIRLLYQWLRNNTTVTATERRVRNDAGTVVLEGDCSDDGTTFQQGKLGTPD